MTNNQSSTVLLRAYTLAKAKRYGEAEALILSDNEISKTAPAIDLLARLRIEQNDRIEAHRLWEELLATHPNYLPARQALKYFDHKPSVFTKRRCIIGGMILLFIIGIVIGMKISFNRVPQEKTPIVYAWETFPRYTDLQVLQSHRGTIKRIFVSSHLFAEAKAAARRQNLLEILTHSLDLKPECIYFAQHESNASPERVTLTIETH